MRGIVTPPRQMYTCAISGAAPSKRNAAVADQRHLRVRVLDAAAGDPKAEDWLPQATTGIMGGPRDAVVPRARPESLTMARLE